MTLVCSPAPARVRFELAALDGSSYLLIGLAVLAVILRLIWRTCLFERFLQLDWREA